MNADPHRSRNPAGSGSRSRSRPPNPVPAGEIHVFKDDFDGAASFVRFLEEVEEQRTLWEWVYANAEPQPGLRRKARGLERHCRILCVGEDWCTDSAHTIPQLSRLAEITPALEVRVLRRDRNPELLEVVRRDSETIPAVLMLDRYYRIESCWGPRPSALEVYFNRELKGEPEEIRSAGLRGWYVRDGGWGALGEILDRLLEADRSASSR